MNLIHVYGSRLEVGRGCVHLKNRDVSPYGSEMLICL